MDKIFASILSAIFYRDDYKHLANPASFMLHKTFVWYHIYCLSKQTTKLTNLKQSWKPTWKTKNISYLTGAGHILKVHVCNQLESKALYIAWHFSYSLHTLLALVNLCNFCQPKQWTKQFQNDYNTMWKTKI